METSKLDRVPDVTKAGLIVYGHAPDKDGNQRPHVLACWSEGRFKDKVKAYAMPKGSIDAGEAVLPAALREAEEETGVDFRRLLGKDAFARFCAGETIKDIDSGYEGVRIIRACPNVASDHAYISGHGARHRTQYFVMELEGIEKLEPHLKRMDPAECSADAEVKKAASVWKQEKSLPLLADLVEVLRSGTMPQALRDRLGISKAPEKVLDKTPVLPELEAKWKETHTDADLTQIEHWREFCGKTGGFGGLVGDFDALKKYLQEHQVISDSGQSLKLDTRDKPLSFYQEGGAILPVGELLARMENVAGLSDVYRKSAWGLYVGKHRPAASAQDKALSAQNSPLVAFFTEHAPEEVSRAFAHKRVGRVARQENGLDALPLAKRSFVAHAMASCEDPTTRNR